MKFFKHVLAGLFLFYSIHQPVFSQQSVLNPVIVTGTLSEQYLSDALTSVTVINRNAIEKSQASSLADLLQGEAGFEFARNGGLGSTTSFFIRGQASKNLAVYVDGVRTSVDQVGSLQLTEFPLALIEKIEILRGNAAALYGDAAIGGVINIFTRQGAGQPTPYGGVSIGSYGYREVNAGYGGLIEDYKFNLQASSQISSGFSAMNTAQKPLANPDTDGQMAQFFSFNIEKQIVPNSAIGVRANHSNSENQYDYAVAFDNPLQTDLHKQIKSSDSHILYWHGEINKEWKSKLDIADSQIKYDDYLNGVINTSYYAFGRNNGTQKTLKWFNTYALNDKAMLNFGTDYSEDELIFIGTHMDSYSMKRSSRGIFTGLNYSSGLWAFQTNIRRDAMQIANTDASSVMTRINPESTSGLIGVGYSFFPELKLTSSLSNGFSSPTAYDVSQNTRLTPEKFNAKEVGLSYSNEKQLLRLVFFEIQTQNSIDYDDNNVASNAYASINRGIESTVQMLWGGFHIKGSLVNQNPLNITYSEALARRAKQYGSIDVSRRIGAYDLGAKLFASSERKDNHYSSDVLKSYSLLSIYGSREIGKNLIARVKLQNLLDESYQLAYGYNTPGRNILATLTYQLR